MDEHSHHTTHTYTHHIFLTPMKFITKRYSYKRTALFAFHPDTPLPLLTTLIVQPTTPPGYTPPHQKCPHSRPFDVSLPLFWFRAWPRISYLFVYWNVLRFSFLLSFSFPPLFNYTQTLLYYSYLFTTRQFHVLLPQFVTPMGKKMHIIIWISYPCVSTYLRWSASPFHSLAMMENKGLVTLHF